MKPPANAEIKDLANAIMWLDSENGIVCAISKKGPQRTPESLQDTLNQFKQLVGDQKIYLLLDITEISEITREGRDFIAAEFPKYLHAMAIVSESAFGTMVANIFFAIKSQPYPTKMFTDEEQAKAWLKKQQQS